MAESPVAPHKIRTWTDQQIKDFLAEYKAAGPMLQVITKGVLEMVIEEQDARFEDKYPK